MRLSNTVLLAASLLTASLLAAPSLHAASRHARTSKASAALAPVCEYDADRTAFEIEGLKSQLMVTALSCHQQNKYNAFMSRYQPDVAREESDLGVYFKRSYGRQSTKAYDDYISNLANVQSQDSLKAGTAFCENLSVMFDEVMSLHSASELHEFSNAKVIAQPITFHTCAGSPPAASTTRKARHGGKSQHG